MIWGVYLLVGVVAGLLAGLFGIGGGVILVPAFLFLFAWQGVPAELIAYLALGSSLACIVFSSAVATWTHHQTRSVQWSLLRWLVPGIILGSYVGVRTVTSIPSDVLNVVIGVFLIVLSVKFMLNIRVSLGRADTQKTHPIESTTAGAFIGWVSGIFGIGGGTLTVPYVQRCGHSMQNAVATSAACGFPLALVGALSNAYVGFNVSGLPSGAIGYVFLPAVCAIVLTSMPFAKFGAALAHRLPETQLRRCFGLFLGVIGVFLVLNGRM